MLYIETSAKENIGINQVFEELVSKILENPVIMESLGFSSSIVQLSSTTEVVEATRLSAERVTNSPQKPKWVRIEGLSLMRKPI